MEANNTNRSNKMECVEFLADLNNARKLARKFMNSKGVRDVDLLESLTGDIYIAATSFTGGNFRQFIIQRAKWAMCNLFRSNPRTASLSEKFEVSAEETVNDLNIAEFMETLTMEEKEIAELSAQGLTVREIESRLNVNRTKISDILGQVKSKAIQFAA
jgi:DNA-binding NarL/FixJ family response regulator